MAGVTSVSDGEESIKGAATKGKPVQGDPESEGEEEYEIEQVLDAKRGYFPDVCMVSSKLAILHSNDAFFSRGLGTHGLFCEMEGLWQ
jgi:hypothetical protein